jgi:hypothetical protein
VRAPHSHATTVHGDCKITVQFSHGFFPLNRVIAKTRKVRSRITRVACTPHQYWCYLLLWRSQAHYCLPLHEICPLSTRSYCEQLNSNLKTAVLRDMTPCGLGEVCRCVWKTCSNIEVIHLHGGAIMKSVSSSVRLHGVISHGTHLQKHGPQYNKSQPLKS